MIYSEIYAAMGDLPAQAKMVDQVLDRATAGEMEIEPALEQAEHWARLAAAHGWIFDSFRLCAVLAMRAGYELGFGNRERAVDFAAKTLRILDDLADEGSEDAARQLVTVGAQFADVGLGTEPFTLAGLMEPSR